RQGGQGAARAWRRRRLGRRGPPALPRRGPAEGPAARAARQRAHQPHLSPGGLIEFGRKNRSACDRTPAYIGDMETRYMKDAMNPNPSAISRYASDEGRWRAVQARDSAADGHFVYAVRSTGVYCRPSSSARLPRRENVEFFESAAAA